MIVANDATVKGGTYYPMTVKKHLRAQEIAAQNRLPCIYLVDSGGAFLPLQDEVFPDKEHFGRIFYNQANLSAAGIAAGRRGDGLVHRGRRLRAGDVRRVDHREEPGHDLPRRPAAGEGRHRRSRDRRGAGRRRRALAHLGVTDHLADDDRHALAIAREIVRQPRAAASAGSEPASRSIPVASPSTPPRSSTASSPTDPRQPFDVREVIARLVDGSEFHEFKALYGTTLVTGFAQHPRPSRWASSPTTASCSRSRRSRARTSSSCARSAASRSLFLQNITGFMVGQQVRERRHRQGRRQDGDRGVVREGAQAHRDPRRLVRRRQLRHVRPRLQPALPLDLAQRAHLGDGRRAGRLACSPP